MFIKPIKSSGSHPAKINCRRTKTTNRYSFPDKTFKYFKETIGHIDIRVWEPGNQAGLDRFGLFTDALRDALDPRLK